MSFLSWGDIFTLLLGGDRIMELKQPSPPVSRCLRSSVKLTSMRLRHIYCCALVVLIVLAAVPVFHGGTHLAIGSPGGVSAPRVPCASVESAPEARPLQSHFDGCAHTVRHTNLLPGLRTSRAGEVARQIEDISPPSYGPLHRRPPPSFS